VLKPVTDERFARALARGKESVRMRRQGDADAAGLAALLRERSRLTRRILVRDRDRTRVIDVETIERIEAADYYAMIYAGGESFLLRETLNELEQRLDPARFFRVHRSAIIPLDRVREIHALFRGDREIVLADGTRVRLPRTRRAAFEAQLAAAARPAP
jgi:two-component system LytT family response regulator